MGHGCFKQAKAGICIHGSHRQNGVEDGVSADGGADDANEGARGSP